MSTRRRSRTAVIATPVAERSLLELRRTHGDPVLLLQEDDEPLCLPAHEMFVAREDAFAGVVAGCPVYLGRALDARHADVIEVDVETGPPEVPSLAASPTSRFVAHARRRDPCTELFADVPSPRARSEG